MEKFRPNQYEGEAPSKRPDIAHQYDTVESTSQSEETNESRDAIEKVKNVLARVDEKALFDIFREYFGKVGNDISSLEETITPVSKIKVVYDQKSGTAGEYSNFKVPEINAFISSSGGENAILNTIIHEYLHEISALFSTTSMTTLQNGIGVFSSDSVLGVSQILQEFRYDTHTGDVITQSVNIFNQKINEGITQMMTDDLHLEYAKRVGEGIRGLQQNNDELMFVSPDWYGPEQLNVRIYITLLSTLADVPEEVVKNALIRTYFRNGDVVPDEIKELFPISTLSAEQLTSLVEEALDSTDFVEFLQKRLLPLTGLSKSKELAFNKKLSIIFAKYIESIKPHISNNKINI